MTPLDETLAHLAKEAQAFEDPWWIIGSAAAHICGADIGQAADVDLVLSRRDAVMVLERWQSFGVVERPLPSDQFRSAVFGRCLVFSKPIEVMAGFEMVLDGEWCAMEPKTRVEHEVPGGALFTPSVDEQISLLSMMNRPKDASRITALRLLI